MVGEHPERRLGGARAQQLVQLLHQPRRRRAGQILTMGGDGVLDGRIDTEVESRGHGDGAQHPHRIFLKALRRVADAADETVAQILQPAGVVDDRERADVVEQRVDGEVAPEGVLFRCAERVVAMHQPIAAVGVPLSSVASRRLGGERRELASSSAETSRRNVATSIVLRPEAHVRQAEAPPDDPAVPEQAS